ncbi:unnamed protein product, partial [Lampetra fluviatilis]
ECACIDPKWMGALCDRCVDGLYGPDCLALPVVLDVLPKEGSDLGGTTVTVMGRNLKASADGGYRCEFGDQVVEGTWLSREQVRCVTPKHVAGTVLVNVAPDRSGQSPFTTSTVEFTFYQQCPTSGCGRLLGTPHGICSFGQCVCTLPWHGDNCELEYLAPVLEAVPDATTIEGQSYREALRLLGEPVLVIWQLTQGPTGLHLDGANGVVSWDVPVAQQESYVIEVTAINQAGSASTRAS